MRFVAVFLIPLSTLGLATVSQTAAATGNSYAFTPQHWSQTSTNILSAGIPASALLHPCPSGVDLTSGAGYDVFIDDDHPESVLVTAGSSGTDGCSIRFTPYFSHSRYKLGSASSGIQEMINTACGTSSAQYQNRLCDITLSANGSTGGATTYNVYGTIFLHANNSVLRGYGASLDCHGRGPCLQVGDLANANNYRDNTVSGLEFVSTNYSAIAAYSGVRVTDTSRLGGTVTITTATAHGFRPGDMVTILFTDNNAYWGDAVVKTVPSSRTFTYSHTGSDIAPQVTPGVVALAYSAILDNSENTHFTDVSNKGGWFNNFFDMWDDENATIDHFETAAADVNHGDNWAGSFVFSVGNQGVKHQIAPVISLLNSTITSSANGITVFNSNGLYIENTVIQGTSLWQVHSSNETGNYQGVYLKNIYSESSINANPLTPANSPFPGLGIAGLIVGGGDNAQIAGNGGVQGAFQTGGKGSISYSYFIVANDETTRTQTSPMQVLNWFSTGTDAILVRWPRIANGADIITYDVIRATTRAGVGTVFPYTGGCPGGVEGTCGYVARGLSQLAACLGSLVCTYKDNGSSTTAPYTIKQGSYGGTLAFWPGSIVSVRNSVTVDKEEADVVGVGLNGNPLQIAHRCTGYGVASPGGYTTCLTSITTANNSVPNQTATIVTDGPEAGGGTTLSKGRLNFSTTTWAALQPHHIITLIDSQPALTRATAGYRPSASANDTWIGTDVPRGGVGLASGQLAFGAPVSITSYIRATGDGVYSNWLERLTSIQKTFAVPVKISEGNSLTLGDGSPLSQMRLYTVHNPATGVPPQSCVDVVREAKGITELDQVTGISPPGKLGNLTINGYPGDAGTIIFHFCNPSRLEAITPEGAYSFLSVH